MANVSATFEGEAVTIIDVKANGSQYHVLYLDSSNEYNISRRSITSGSDQVIATSASTL